MMEREKHGVWLIGAKGGLATTLLVGAKAIKRGLASTVGLVTELAPFNSLPLVPIESLVFGGYDIKNASVFEQAEQIAKNNGTLDRMMLQEIREDLHEIDSHILPGTSVNCGSTIESLGDMTLLNHRLSLSEQVLKIQEDLQNFKERNNLKDIVVVNVSSTEPPLHSKALKASFPQLEDIIARNSFEDIRAGTIYALACVQKGYPLVNFTPSNSYFLPAIEEVARMGRVPYMGNDGKTGESLVKATLAPMFAYRNLRVLSWQGYNILGDQDGKVLADETVKESKIRTKEPIVANILGYPLHSRVGIDYVPSLDDWKTAWDFIHFQGFLDVKMSCQLIWQGCDAILAAPLVLDLVRFAYLAKEKGECGPMGHLGCYFKSPLHQNEHNFHKQFERLLQYSQNVIDHRRAGRG